MRIETYKPRNATFCAYDPRVVAVAQRIAAAIQSRWPELRIEHVGSTSVPGCGGKGIVDLAVLYPDGTVARARQVLDDLGFQKQRERENFPETRPMRVGACTLDGHNYRIHAHVIAVGSDEHIELVRFRDRLRADARLSRQYEERKREILASGVTDAQDYCKAKGVFIQEALISNNSDSGSSKKVN